MEEELREQGEGGDDRDRVSGGPGIAASRLTEPSGRGAAPAFPGHTGNFRLVGSVSKRYGLSAACRSAGKASVEQHRRVQP